MLWYAFLVLCVVTISSQNEDEWKLVQTAQGPVRGRKEPDGIFVFYNIPYGTAPTGENKFKAPLPPPNWKGVLEATDKGVVCPQSLVEVNNKTIQEDCLIANIYVPDTVEKDLSVMVHIHGGALRYGFGDSFKAKNLMKSKKLIVAHLPPPVWLEPYDAIDKEVICPQPSFPRLPNWPLTLKTLENCLMANVYVPNTKEKDLSVVVYVHGGAFILGYGEMFKYTQFMKTKDIIIVTFNYRLGVHGFLCLGTEDVPGNVDLLMLSKSAEGLFHRVIPESGANIAAFTIQRDPVEIAKTYARKLNFTNVDDIYALEEFYKTTPIDLLTADTFIDRTDSTFLFSPCVERDTGDGGFLTESPLSIFKKGNYKKLPVLYGFAQMEGLMRVDFFDIWKHKMNEKFSDFLSPDLKFESEEEREEVANKVKVFYFGDKPVSEDNILGYVDFFLDVIFVYPMLWATKLQVEAGNKQIYLYEYSFVDEDVPIVPHTNIRGAHHCAQTVAMMDGKNMTHHDETFASSDFKRMKKVVRKIWHNFIKTGKPVPEESSLPAWPAAGADRSPYMELDEKVELRGVLLEERTHFWEEIYQKHYRDAVPPPIPTPKSRVEL